MRRGYQVPPVLTSLRVCSSWHMRSLAWHRRDYRASLNRFHMHHFNTFEWLLMLDAVIDATNMRSLFKFLGKGRML